MINRKYYSAFASNEGFGSVFVKKLYDYFGGDIESAWNADISDLYRIEGLKTQKINSFINLRNKINPDFEFAKLNKSDISLLTYEDEDYPTLLKEIPDAPMWLYYIGNKKLFNSKYNIAVVGSRKCSATGKSILAKIISEFRGSDLCIVSGMALGIDAAAHQAALDNNLSTIAVLGTGLNVIYPHQNRQLYKNIISNGGLIISEYPVYANANAFHFPLRNRIVSGLSPCTLVAEAAMKSGALITARLCLEQNRELMCIPGAINNPSTEGIYKLLKEGAGIVTCGNDILKTMNWKLSINKEKFSVDNGLSEQENHIIELLRQDSLTIDEIADKTGLHIDDLMIILTRLELDDIIIQAEGERYCAI